MASSELQILWSRHDLRLNKRTLIEALIVGTILGIIAPYNTSELSEVVWRFTYWIVLALFATAISTLVAQKLIPKLIERNLTIVPAFAVFTVVLAIPITIAVIALDVITSGILLSSDGISFRHAVHTLENMPGGTLGYLTLFGQVWLLAVLITGTLALIQDKLYAGKQQTALKPSGYKFLNRIPPELGNNLVCLSMEDHYVRVHTTQGDTMILLRMADALSELEDFPGIQTHRSWWVATEAIDRVVKDGRKYIVQLTNNMTAPVSQTHQSKLKDMGLI